MNGSKENYLYQLDCQLRREKNGTRREQIKLLMAQIRNDVPDHFIKRQVELMASWKPDDTETH